MRARRQARRMQLAPRDPRLPFVPVTPLGPKVGPSPELEYVPSGEEPANDSGLVSVRYHGVESDRHGDVSTRFTVRNDNANAGEYWQQLTGSFDDAVNAARGLAVVEGFEDNPAQGAYARTSVAILDAGNGVYQLLPMKYPDGMGDGMDPIISMPIDAVPASSSSVSVPYGRYGKRVFDTPTRIEVRFDDPRVMALVGVDSIALAPTS